MAAWGAGASPAEAAAEVTRPSSRLGNTLLSDHPPLWYPPNVDLLLHPPDEARPHRRNRRGKLSTVGHAAAFRAFARAANRVGVRFMVVGGTFRDVAVRASSTRDIDIVLVDRKELPEDAMHAAGFERIPASPHAWRFTRRGTEVELQVAALASSRSLAGPFSIAFKEAVPRKIEGCEVPTPRIEDFVILKLVAAHCDMLRRNRDLADIQSTLFAYPELSASTLSIPSLRARLRDLYGIKDTALRRLTALLRQVPRP